MSLPPPKARPSTRQVAEHLDVVETAAHEVLEAGAADALAPERIARLAIAIADACMHAAGDLYVAGATAGAAGAPHAAFVAHVVDAYRDAMAAAMGRATPPVPTVLEVTTALARRGYIADPHAIEVACRAAHLPLSSLPDLAGSEADAAAAAGDDDDCDDP